MCFVEADGRAEPKKRAVDDPRIFLDATGLHVKFDWWLTGICSSRVFSQIVAMTYAAALPVLQQEWAMSAAAAGSIASAFQIGYTVSLFVFSIVADRVGPKPIYLGSMSASAFFSLAFAFFARNYLSAVILYSLVGVSLGGTYTTGLMILAVRYPVKRRGMATGLFIASTSLGYVLSLALSGIALPLGGYRLSFMLTCLGPFVGSILTWLTLSRTAIAPVRLTEQRGFRRDVLANEPAMLLIGGYAFHTWELLGMWAWAPAFLFSCLASRGTGGLDAAGIGAYLTAAFHLAGLFASFSMGSLSDHLGRARVILVLSGISTLCSFVFGWTIAWPFSLVILVGLLYAFSSLGDSPVLSAALTEVVPTPYLGAAFGLRSLLGFGAGSISPLVFGAVLDWTNPLSSGSGQYHIWGWAFTVLGLAGFGAVWSAYRLGKT